MISLYEFKTTLKIQDAILKQVAFKHSALLLNEELFNDIFYNEHLLYNTCFEKGTFYFYQGRKF